MSNWNKYYKIAFWGALVTFIAQVVVSVAVDPYRRRSSRLFTPCGALLWSWVGAKSTQGDKTHLQFLDIDLTWMQCRIMIRHLHAQLPIFINSLNTAQVYLRGQHERTVKQRYRHVGVIIALQH
jgi:hypothetical protein